MSPDSVSQSQANPQSLNRYTYVLNNPVLHTDPSGHCIPGIGNCQWASQLNVADGAAFARGVGEGVLSVVAGVVTAPIAAASAVANPGAAVAGIQDAAATVARGADFAWNHPGEATAIVNENPEALGHIMGEALGTAAMAKLGSGCSFDADTPVATDHGLVAIGALHIGDTVLAYNEETQTTEQYPITRVWVNLDPVVEHLTLDGKILETTPEHPFFVLLRGWVAAGDLQEGDQVRRIDGSYNAVTAVKLEPQTTVMYNLTVAEAHTYFVGEAGWLVHNTCGGALEDIAAAAHKELREAGLGQSVVASAKNADGSIKLAVYHGSEQGTLDSVTHLQGNGWDVLPAPGGRGPEFHAERQLAEAGFKEIGISRQLGMCNICQDYMNANGVRVTRYKGGR